MVRSPMDWLELALGNELIELHWEKCQIDRETEIQVPQIDD